MQEQPASQAVVAAQPAVAAPVDHSPGLWRLIREDYVVNGCDITRPGFRAMVMYRFGVWRMGVRWRIIRAPLSVLYRFMHRWVRNRYGIELHYTTRIGRRFRIAHQGAIVIHEFATIGDDCTIRQGVTLGAAGRYSIDEAPVLGNNVDVGAGAVIMGRVKVGDNSRIGANAVIMMDVPPNSTAFAQPARVIQPPKPQTA
jgi:serine O-acetyltransferase